MPALVGKFGLNEFKHINPARRSSMSRSTAVRAPSFVAGAPSVNLQDTYVKVADEQQAGACLSMEEALDISLLLPVNPVVLSERHNLNPFARHSE